MTPELKAAAERVRSVAVVGQHSADMRIHLADLYALATAFLAEHPADDDEPVTLEELRRAARECDIQLIVIQDGTVDVWGTVRPKTRGQLRALLKGLGQ